MAFDILKANLDLQATVFVFNDPDANAESVAAAGEAFLHTLYGDRKNDDLNTCKFVCVQQNCCMSTNSLKSLIWQFFHQQTCDSAKQHSFRVYHQVQEWRGKNLPLTD